MIVPLDFWDITLLLAMVSIVLLITSGLSSSYSKKTLIISKKRLNYITIVISFTFLAAIIVRIIFAYLTL